MNEQNIPIDINISRLLEWLISRRHCKKDWYSKAVIIREKISDAIKDMPVRDDVACLLSTIDINYFDCLKLIEILKETEANTKNMFGRYGSQRMKDWQEIMSLYERDNMYLAEAAQMLMKFVKYDIPSLKKQIQKLQQTQDDLDKETEKYKKSERTAKAEFDALCKQLNIPGKNIRVELCETAKTELPKICSKIAERAKSLDDIINFYEAYVKFTSGKEINEDSLKCLKHVIEKGNTMVTEFLLEDSSQQLMSSSDFDIVVVEDGNEKQMEETYDITIENDDAYMENIKCENSCTDIICLQDELVVDFPAPTILEHQTMIDFMNDLFELEAFLKMRKYEFQENKEDLMAFSHIQETSEIVQLSNLQSVQSMLHEIQSIISNMSDSKYQHLYSIRNLPSYADTLTLSLQQKLAVVERMLKYQETSAQKKKEAEERIINLQPVLNHAVQRMKELQTEIEKDISKKYQNRIVHIRGGPIL
ncbi:PREDICTED: CDK5 regulatory subunit-associated protein 3 [Polistes canadensis]|uniref:CDK5 regulatory subunit-associated protein 3 n=1 Tax=Polistes canadensis TaxID=91411 RepID=UPI000718D497|nr:PREDICTED: CDK5 regulatory subunit-associated protein 3 [Polistes canadensis]